MINPNSALSLNAVSSQLKKINYYYKPEMSPVGKGLLGAQTAHSDFIKS